MLRSGQRGEHAAGPHAASFLRLGDRPSQRRFRIMERLVLARVRGCRRVLDLGCGEGQLTAEIDASEVIGVDLRRAALTRARARALQVVLADAHALPFPAGRFDAIVSTRGVFPHLDFDRALAECARVLTAGGVLALHLPSDVIWSPRRPLTLVATESGAPGRSGAALVASAARHGLHVQHIAAWRWLRYYPYLYRVYTPLRARLWNHAILIFRRT